jgi:hypothetical protein
MTAIEIINQIEADKISRHIEPHHATILEVDGVAKRLIRDELNQLWTDRKILVGDTINGKYIKIL